MSPAIPPESPDDQFARLMRAVAGDTRSDAVLAARTWLPAAMGMPSRPVTPGVLDDDARQAYSGGQCHALAAALVEATGWPLLWVGRVSCLYSPHDDICYTYAGEEWPCHCQIEHIGVRAPDGRLLDITGARPIAEFENISTRVGSLSPAVLTAILADPNWPAANLPVARTFASAVLALL